MISSKYLYFLFLSVLNAQHSIFFNHQLYNKNGIQMYIYCSPWLNTLKNFEIQPLLNYKFYQHIGGFLQINKHSKFYITAGVSFILFNNILHIGASLNKNLTMQITHQYQTCGIQYQYLHNHNTQDNSPLPFIQTEPTKENQTNIPEPPQSPYQELKKNLQPIEILFKTKKNQLEIGQKLKEQPDNIKLLFCYFIEDGNIIHAYQHHTTHKGKTITTKQAKQSMENLKSIKKIEENNLTACFKLILHTEYNQNNENLINIWKETEELKSIIHTASTLSEITDLDQIAEILTKKIQKCLAIINTLKKIEGQEQEEEKEENQNKNSPLVITNANEPTESQPTNQQKIDQLFEDKNTIFLLANGFRKKLAAGTSLSLDQIKYLNAIDYTINYVYYYSHLQKYKGKETNLDTAKQELTKAIQLIKDNNLREINDQTTQEFKSLVSKLINNNANNSDKTLLKQLQQKQEFKSLPTSSTFSSLKDDEKIKIINSLTTILARCLENIQTITID